MKIDLQIDRKYFSDNYREKNILLKRDALKGAPFSWDNLNDLLFSVSPSAPFFKIHKNGVVPENEYVVSYQDIGKHRKKIVKSVFYKYMREGATLVLNRANWASPKIQDLCNQLSRFTGFQTLANGYLAFSGTGTFGNHWDTHDVFVTQLIGRKKWVVYKPTFELPLPSQTSLNCKAECPSEPVFEGFLEQGDVLYIPRGWWHNALPQDEPTFHVAIGLHAPKVTDYIGWLCTRRLPELLECRHVMHEGDAFQYVVEAADGITSELLKRENFNAFMQDLISSEQWMSEFKVEHYGNPAEVSIPENNEFKINSSYFSANSSYKNIRLNGFELAEKERHLECLSGLNKPEASALLDSGDSFEEVMKLLLNNDVITV